MKIEKILCICGSGLLTAFTVLFGAVDYSFIFLCLCMVTDFVTGLMCGAYTKTLSSDVCIKGLMKKLIILVYVMIGHHVDVLLGVDYVRTGVCYMYAIGEVLSIIENGVTLGVPIPEPIVKALDILNGGKKE